MRVQKIWDSSSQMIFFFLIFHFISGLLLGATKHSQILLDAEKNIRIIDASNLKINNLYNVVSNFTCAPPF